MLSEVKKRLEGPKFNIDFGGRGWGRQGKGISISTMQKGAILRKCVNTFVPHCSYKRHIHHKKSQKKSQKITMHQLKINHNSRGCGMILSLVYILFSFVFGYGNI